MAASTAKRVLIHSFSWIILLTFYRVLSKGWYAKVIAIYCNDCVIITQFDVIVCLPSLQFERRFVSSCLQELITKSFSCSQTFEVRLEISLILDHLVLIL